MKSTLALLAVAIATAGISCGGSTTQPTQTTPGSAGGGTPLVTGGTPQPVAGPDAPPVGARFQLFCQAFEGPDHVQHAKLLKEQLIQGTGLKGWHLIHSEDQSSIYFGYYRTVSVDDPIPDAQEAARAQADLRRINEMQNGSGDRLFQRTMFVQISEPDPVAPAEWNLVNARPKAMWSLEIAAYRGVPLPGSPVPDRKTGAVDAVRELRAAGIEAYYYHGETISSVCIGAWLPDTIRAQEKDHVDVDPRKDIIVAPPGLSDEALKNLRNRNPNAVVVTPRLDIVDPALIKVMHDFPTHAINGDVYATKKGGQQVLDPSILILIPGREGIAGAPMAQGTGAPNGRTSSSGIDDAAFEAIRSRPQQQNTPATPGRGRLNSIDN